MTARSASQVSRARPNTLGFSERERRLIAERDAIARENDRLWRLLAATFDAWVEDQQPIGRLFTEVQAAVGTREDAP